jgi:hypothetical protein
LRFAIGAVFLGLTVSCGPRSDSESRNGSTQTDSSPTPTQDVSSRGRTCDSAIVGKYSDLRTSSQTGDIGGTEINLQCTDGTYRATVIVAEGAPAPAVEAAAEVHDTTVNLTFQPDSPLSAVQPFHGVVTRGRLIGRFANDETVNLPRRP